MLQVPRRTGFSGPALIRLLARLTEADAPEPGQSLSSQLSQWLGWTHAIALSSALSSPLSGDPAAGTSTPRATGGDEAGECARVRAALTAAIANENASPTGRRGPGRAPARPAPVETAIDYAVYRQRYQFLQQTMETEIASLRARLRTLLAARKPGMTRLAMVDAVMERVLGAREQALLGAVPAMLETHFTRLRQAEEAALADQPAAVTPGAWLGVFRGDMQSVLLAELDIRFQPVEGLLVALRAG